MPDPTGPESETGVEAGATDDFSSHFTEFASGTPDPNGGKSGDGNEADVAGGDEDDKSGEASPPADAPGGKPAAGDATPDPWANASPELIAARNAERAEYERKVAGASGRASGLQRQLTALQTKAALPPKSGDAEGEKSPEDMSDEEWKAFAEDYPEIAKFIAPLREKLTSVEAKVVPITAAREAEDTREAYAALERKHSDYRHYGDPSHPGYATLFATFTPEVKAANAAFNGWLADQKPGIQALYASDDPEEAATVLTLFKSERAAAMKQGEGQPKPTDATGDRRRRQLEGGQDVRSKPGAAASGAPDDDFEGAFKHYVGKREARAARR